MIPVAMIRANGTATRREPTVMLSATMVSTLKAELVMVASSNSLVAAHTRQDEGAHRRQ